MHLRLRRILSTLCVSASFACSGSGDTSVQPTPGPVDAGGTTGLDGAPSPDGGGSQEAGPTVKRLHIQGERVVDDAGKSVRLRGANLKGIDEAGATQLAETLHMNFVRLRLSWEAENRDDADPSAISAAYRAQIDTWIKTLAGHRIWTLIEMRTDDATANEPEIYTPGSAVFTAYQRAWVYLATRFKSQDYIAGYGLLAEPSPDKTPLPDHVGALLDFQRTLMGAITSAAGDAVTPFFVGPAYNYDPLELWNDRYYDGLTAYAGRVVYEVNFLTPKPWIDKGTSIDGSMPSYPTAKVTNYDGLLAVLPGEKYKLPDDSPLVFNARTGRGKADPTPADLVNWNACLSPDFAAWYFARPLAFRAKHHVPLVADQFGASTAAGGQLAYEKDLVTYFEAQDIHWSRWGYNAGEKERRIPDNASVLSFYQTLGAGYPAP
ncbi:MAG: cellulase family glycosylhydrolase [Polyangiaceae bacterium]|nr:cellulase family glycosylhydrolase [Polyangiaceae bacterium]